jgi:hypothetical protein
MSAEIKDFYLNTPMNHYTKYMRILVKDIPDNIIM